MLPSPYPWGAVSPALGSFRKFPWALGALQPDFWVSHLNPQLPLGLASSLHSHHPHWGSDPHKPARRGFCWVASLPPAGPGSSGRSFVSSSCISLQLISGVSLGPGARGDPNMKKKPKSLVQSRAPHNMYLFLLLGQDFSLTQAARTWPRSVPGTQPGLCWPQVSHPSGCLVAPPSILDDSRKVEGGPRP